MPRLIRIDSSSRLQSSHSRQLADRFVAHWKQNHPGGEVLVRDLALDPVPHISNETIVGFYTPKVEHDERMAFATALSDRLINEIMAADIILIDTPMYNFSIPSALKAWIDHVVRIGETFSFSPENGFEGLIKDKEVHVITATGAVFSDETMRPMDFLTPYLSALFSFLGMTDIHFYPLEGSSVDNTAFEKSKFEAENAINKLWVAS